MSRGYADGRYLQLATGGTLGGPLTQVAGSLTLAAGAVGDVIERWNGDINGDTGRYYEWRRGDFGWLELWATEAQVSTMAIRINGDGEVFIPNLNP